MSGFRRGTQPDIAHGPKAFEQALLSDSEKEMLCRALLSEFGVSQVRLGGDGELIHSCCLPFGMHSHGDASASASLNYKRLTYNCFVCGGGGLLWFIATCRGEDVSDARKWLDDQTGAGPEEQSLSSLLEFFDAVYAPEARERAVIPKMSAAVLKPWEFIHPYLTDPIEQGGRGISEAAVIRYHVGYAPEYQLRIPAPTGVVGDEHGMVRISSPRIVIPHWWKGDLVGWQTRRLLADGTPKYLSSPDFPKDVTIFDYHPKEREAVIVESPMSRLVCADDVSNMEATFGAKVTDRQVSLLSIHPRTVLWFDNDKAGWSATSRVGDMLEPYSDVWVVDSPWQQDAGDLPHDERMRLLDDPVPMALWHPPKRLVCFSCQRPAHEGKCDD